ncbi:Com family DNA-binding transcriptional regulator [Chitinibacter sp. ZOR0017]|uniref:Com family DNA-binding transcriptional regulator n=1 Tax=Chitinibacter sp. ZOR0017 TaxID=1339254 RepID=UPI0009DEDC53|nr:Com family DNA-binding transcriptional regulator [Chitinibacter sp. ZOR0017]
MINSIRCGQCDRKLAEGRYLELSIKCPRCGNLNQYQSISERHRAPNQGKHDGSVPHHSVARRQAPNS